MKSGGGHVNAVRVGHQTDSRLAGASPARHHPPQPKGLLALGNLRSARRDVQGQPHVSRETFANSGCWGPETPIAPTYPLRRTRIPQFLDSIGNVSRETCPSIAARRRVGSECRGYRAESVRQAGPGGPEEVFSPVCPSGRPRSTRRTNVSRETWALPAAARTEMFHVKHHVIPAWPAILRPAWLAYRTPRVIHAASGRNPCQARQHGSSALPPCITRQCAHTRASALRPRNPECFT